MRATIGVALWVTMGTIVASASADLGFASSLEFAVAAITTGGLMGFPATDNELSSFHASFVAIYCLVGVPLYGMWIGKWAMAMTAEDTRIHARLIAEASLEDLDDTVAEAYVSSYMPLLYPSVEEGGYMTKADFDERSKVINPGEGEDYGETPPLMDALMMHLISEGIIDLEMIAGFNEGWDSKVGSRRIATIKATSALKRQKEKKIGERKNTYQPPTPAGD